MEKPPKIAPWGHWLLFDPDNTGLITHRTIDPFQGDYEVTFRCHSEPKAKNLAWQSARLKNQQPSSPISAQAGADRKIQKKKAANVLFAALGGVVL